MVVGAILFLEEAQGYYVSKSVIFRRQPKKNLGSDRYIYDATPLNFKPFVLSPWEPPGEKIAGCGTLEAPYTNSAIRAAPQR